MAFATALLGVVPSDARWRSPARVVTLIGLTLIGAPAPGCLDNPPPLAGEVADASLDSRLDAESAVDASSERPFGLVRIDVSDRNGRPWPVDGIPRSPIITLTTSHRFDHSDSVLLFTMRKSPELESDLRRKPVLASHQAHLVETQIEQHGLELEMTPTGRLPHGTALTLAIGAWAKAEEGGAVIHDGPVLVELEVAREGGGGSVIGSWPANGTAPVPVDLTRIVIAVDDRLAPGLAPLGQMGVRLSNRHGVGEPIARSVATCGSLGLIGSDCIEIRLERSLETDEEYVVSVDRAALDHTGASLGPWTARFRTGAYEPPQLIEVTCALDEVMVGSACVLADDERVVVRVDASGPARYVLESSFGRSTALAPRGLAALVLAPVPLDRPLEAALRVFDLRENEQTVELRFEPPGDLLPLTITEVLADPTGREPTQEYVEILNYGREPIELTGISLSDAPLEIGDVLVHASALPPGERALVVADAFDPDDTSDAPVPAATRLVRVGASIGKAGISNSGEPLFLRDGEGRRLSATPAFAGPSGHCLTRIAEHARSGDPSAFEVVPGCTPGLPAHPDHMP